MVVEVDGRAYRVRLPDGIVASAGRNGRVQRRSSATPRRTGTAVAAPTGNSLTSPIQGTVLSVAVEQGASVEAGQLICIVEAMKMENEITAHQSGTVTDLSVAPGGTVQTGATIAVIEP
jgi:acetyl-CoA/propionyl-CoA carboxylase biotin carboxyl carrier protein